MQIFLNERSVDKQYASHYAFAEAVKEFAKCVQAISELLKDINPFKSQFFFYFEPIKGTHFETALKVDHSVNSIFFNNLQLLNPKNWQDSIEQDAAANYHCLGQNYNGTSVAEIAERKLKSVALKGFLLNFQASPFANNLTVTVVKNEKEKVAVDCHENSEELIDWLKDNDFIVTQPKYDEFSGIAPRDYETVLFNRTVFERTQYPKNNGRTVYRKIGTKELWAVDSASKHAGPKAHIEVFDETTKKHLGTSLYNIDNLDKKEKVVGRTIDLG